MIDEGPGVLDSFTQVKTKVMVNASAYFLPGMKVSVYRPKDWVKLAELTISEIPVDARRRPTNELIFTEPLPTNIRPGDCLVYEPTK